jgi:nucleotide sugar dehydrogenase
MRIGIFGYGFVGSHIHNLFRDSGHDVIIHDPAKEFVIDSDAAINFGFVCTPTPMKPDGACDWTSVLDTVAGFERVKLFVIKSTVPPGTTQLLRERIGAPVVFSPEYMGESRYYTSPEFPSPHDSRQHGFMIVGGKHPEECSLVADLFLPIMGPTCRFRFMTSTEAELIKYAENSYFALKVTFANELRRIAEAIGCNYHTVREGWLDDPRVGPMHSAAFKDAPGFGGKCLPKDISALAAFCRERGVRSTLLEAVIKTNRHEGPQ